MIIEPDEARDVYEALSKCWHTSEVAQEMVEKLGKFIRQVEMEEDDGPEEA